MTAPITWQGSTATTRTLGPAGAGVSLVSGSAVTAQASSATSITATGMEIAAINTVLVAVVTFESLSSYTSVSTVEAEGPFGGISFTKRSGVNGGSSGNGYQRNEIWWATSAASISAASVTASLAAEIDDAAMVVFAVSGANTSSPWDTNSSLTATSTSSGTCTVSTNSSNPFVVMVGAQNTSELPNSPTPSGTVIGTVENGGAEYWQFLTVDYYTPGVALSSASVGYTGNLTSNYYQITVDAIVPAPTTNSFVLPLGSSVLAGDTLIAAITFAGDANVGYISDTSGGRWIQVASSYYTYGTSQGVEIWMARGLAAGSASVTFSIDAYTETTVGVSVSEWSNIFTAAPVDQWCQNYSPTADNPSALPLTPRQSGDLFLGAVSAAGSISAVVAGYTPLPVPGNGGFAAAYEVASGSVASTIQWINGDGPNTCAVAAACFLNGPQNVNPDLQFPETLVQICTLPDWQAPLLGTGIWTDISYYVQSMSLGPIGRQHELDRIQASPAQITLDNRFGQFNPWNTTSFLYNSGNGLRPMNPVRVVAAWDGATTPVYYGYFQSITNSIKDVLDVDAQLNCIDIMQMMSLKYIAGDNYAQLVESDGGSSLKAYYRLGDAVGVYTVRDYSGNGNTGSLLEGVGGPPAYGQTGPFLYDPSTCIDLTNGTQVLNGGIQTIDLTTQPPSVYQPLASASSWSLECWVMYTGTSVTPGNYTTLLNCNTTAGDSFIQQSVETLNTAISVGDLVTGPGIPAGTYVTGMLLFLGSFYLLSQPATTNISGGTFNFFSGGVGSTLFSMTGSSGEEIDVRVANYTAASVTTFSGVVAGTVSGGPANPITPAIGAAPINQSVQDGNWHHIVVTYNHIDTSVTVYVDGVQDSEGAANFPLGSTPNLTIGSNGGPINGWPGYMSDVALYSTVLSGTQIANHYATGIWFQSQELTISTGPTGRLVWLLDVVGFPLSAVYVPYNWVTELYGTLGQGNSGAGNQVTLTSALNYIQTLSETEPGVIFQAPNGLLYAYNRQYQYKNPTSTVSQGVFGDNTSTAAYHYDGQTLTLGQDDLDLFNDIQVQSGRGGYTLSATNSIAGGAQQASAAPFTVGGGQLQEAGPAQFASAATSASIYGSRTLQGLTSLLMEYDGDALAIAENYLQWFQDPIFRVQQIKLNSYANGGNNIPQMLERGILDRITVQYQGQVQGPQFSQDSLIESISHSVDIANGPVWSTTFSCSPYEILLEPTYLGVWTFGSAASVGVLTL